MKSLSIFGFTGSIGSQALQILRKHKEQFIAAVEENRDIDRSELIKLADGRVFTGLQSKDLGLVDMLGTFDDAINIAGALGNIKGKPKTIEINKNTKPNKHKTIKI